MIELARILALLSTENQFDKNGDRYFYHLSRVADSVSSYGKDYVIVAFLHDIVEDGHMSLEELSKYHFSNDILIAIDAISKRKGEQYALYIERVAKNNIARIVKIADLLDNMNIFRLRCISKEDIKRSQKYAQTYSYLLSELET